eukprot:12044-Prorocentrum_minimum.AAC.1
MAAAQELAAVYTKAAAEAIFGGSHCLRSARLERVHTSAHLASASVQEGYAASTWFQVPGSR